MEPSVPVVAGSVPLHKGADFSIRAAARILDTVFLTIFAGIIGAVLRLAFGVLAAVGAVPASTAYSWRRTCGCTARLPPDAISSA